MATGQIVQSSCQFGYSPKPEAVRIEIVGLLVFTASGVYKYQGWLIAEIVSYVASVV